MRLLQFAVLTIVIATTGSVFASHYYDDSDYLSSACYYDSQRDAYVCPQNSDRHYQNSYSPSHGVGGSLGISVNGDRGYSNRGYGYSGRDYNNHSRNYNRGSRYSNHDYSRYGRRGRSHGGVEVNVGGFGIGVGGQRHR